MAGRIALVTGANRGIGFAACRQLAEAGLQVFPGTRTAFSSRTANVVQETDYSSITISYLHTPAFCYKNEK